MVPQSLIRLSLLGIVTTLASANVEKTIFLGPEPIFDTTPQQQHPALSGLGADLLTPEAWSLRTHLDAAFPTAELPRGPPTWLVLDGLAEGQRYEVRVCWLATQPTEFHLETYTLPAVLESPELIASLYNYTTSRQHPVSPPHGDDDGTSTTPPPTRERRSSSSTLLLRIDAAADYFSADPALMRRPPPVAVDVILDPFVLNVLPRTLVPTAAYAVLVAGLSWLLSTRLVVPRVRRLMVGGPAAGQQGRKEQ